jgi:hypothetical protein
MIRSIAVAAGLALAAPACAQAPQPNAYSDRLAKLTDLERRGALRSAVIGSNLYCRRIGGVAFQQSFKNLKMWVVRCDSGADYGVFIGPDGTVQPRLCRDLVTLKLPACRLTGLAPGPKPDSRPAIPSLAVPPPR